jgi:hypothetical protein
MIARLSSMMNDLAGTSAARSGAILFIYLLILLGICGLLSDPVHALGWMIVMGLGAGGSLVLRQRDARGHNGCIHAGTRDQRTSQNTRAIMDRKPWR